MELALEVKFISTFTEFTRPWWRTLTNGSDVKYVFPRCHTNVPSWSQVSQVRIESAHVEVRMAKYDKALDRVASLRQRMLERTRAAGASVCARFHIVQLLQNTRHDWLYQVNSEMRARGDEQGCLPSPEESSGPLTSSSSSLSSSSSSLSAFLLFLFPLISLDFLSSLKETVNH